MVDLHRRFPSYGFDVHKGYCTRVHDDALLRLGPCDEHRWRFVNVREAAAARDRDPVEAVSDDVRKQGVGEVSMS